MKLLKIIFFNLLFLCFLNGEMIIRKIDFPCACKVLKKSPAARWTVNAVDTPYARGNAAILEGRNGGYFSLASYTCQHGVQLSIYMDGDIDECRASTKNFQK